jgi:hypothetical protein
MNAALRISLKYHRAFSEVDEKLGFACDTVRVATSRGFPFGVLIYPGLYKRMYRVANGQVLDPNLSVGCESRDKSRESLLAFGKWYLAVSCVVRMGGLLDDRHRRTNKGIESLVSGRSVFESDIDPDDIESFQRCRVPEVYETPCVRNNLGGGAIGCIVPNLLVSNSQFLATAFGFSANLLGTQTLLLDRRGGLSSHTSRPTLVFLPTAFRNRIHIRFVPCTIRCITRIERIVVRTTISFGERRLFCTRSSLAGRRGTRHGQYWLWMRREQNPSIFVAERNSKVLTNRKV